MTKTFYGEQRVAMRKSVLEIKSIYGLDPYRDIYQRYKRSGKSGLVVLMATDFGNPYAHKSWKPRAP